MILHHPTEGIKKMSDDELNELRGNVTSKLRELRSGECPTHEVTTAIDALIKGHMDAVRNDWLRAAGVLVKP